MLMAPPHNLSTITNDNKLEYCLRNLMAFDIASTVINAHNLKDISRANTQLLINKIFDLPIKESQDENCLVSLPEKAFITFPRFRQIPVAKPKTKWQKFAELKNIKKKKRSKLVWDNVKKDWVRRWGKDSIKKNAKYNPPIIEVKDNDKLHEDPFEKLSRKKELLKAKQKLREMKNLIGNGNKLDSYPVDLQRKKTHNKDEIKEILKRVQTSTASYGRFDELVDGEIKSQNINRQKIKTKPLSIEKRETVDLAERIVREMNSRHL